MIGTASHVPAVTFLRSKILPSWDSPPVSAVGCPRMLSEVHNTVTDRNEWLEFLLPRNVLELMIPPTTRCRFDPRSGLSFLFLREDLQETKIGTISYRNHFYNANLGGMEVLAKVVFPSYNKDVHAHLAAQHIAPVIRNFKLT